MTFKHTAIDVLQGAALLALLALVAFLWTLLVFGVA